MARESEYKMGPFTTDFDSYKLEEWARRAPTHSSAWSDLTSFVLTELDLRGLDLETNNEMIVER